MAYGMVTCAVIWLAQKERKAILKLTTEHYAENGMSDLITEYDSAYNINIKLLRQTIERLKTKNWMQKCSVWLYRGAWQEWETENIDMAVPLSPDELLRKRRAIFKHQSQKDRPLFPETDAREFWQRAEERNRNTAKLYDALGLPEYEAIEAFKRYDF